MYCATAALYTLRIKFSKTKSTIVIPKVQLLVLHVSNNSSLELSVITLIAIFPIINEFEKISLPSF